MAKTTFGPHRGADWLGRVALVTDAPHAAAERFVLRLEEPKHGRALWVQWTLETALGSTQVRVDAVFADPITKRHEKIGEVWPLSRLLVDPERAGVGVGECHLDDGNAWGLLRDATRALSFSAAFAANEPGQPLAPSASWLMGRRLSSHVVLPVPSAKVHSGYIELWQSLGRNAPRERLDVSGWHASVCHAWGAPPSAPAVTVQLRPDATQAATLSVVSYPTQLFSLIGRRATLAEARTGELSLSLVSRRHLLGSPAPAALSLSQEHYRFELVGHRGRLTGEVHAPAAETQSVPGPAGTTLYVCERAQLEATLEVFGQASVPLKSERASFEAMLPSA